MNYWIDLFTGTTWEEFQTAGATTSGFRRRMRSYLRKIRPGEILLCYLTGVMRWVGALEVIGPSDDKRRIWQGEEFPVRFSVRPMVLLKPEHGVPMRELEGKVDFYRGPGDAGKFKGFVRGSPRRFKRPEDGQLILDLLRAAEKQPVVRPVDPKKLAKQPFFRAEKRKGKTVVPEVVSVPESEEATASASETEPATASTLHTQIQYLLLELGAEMGLEVWVARNDRSKLCNGVPLGSMAGMIDEIPTQFNEATNRTIEMIDVLWLKGNSIAAAFEVEATTSVYSGLLRMSDLLALQPNLEIKLFLVAPDDRRGKVEQEISRPTFKLRDRPLTQVCGFLPFSKLIEMAEAVHKLGLASSLKPDFLARTAEFFGSESP